MKSLIPFLFLSLNLFAGKSEYYTSEYSKIICNGCKTKVIRYYKKVVRDNYYVELIKIRKIKC